MFWKNRKMNILVIGSEGMLGKEVFTRLSKLSQERGSRIGQVVGMDVKDGIDVSARHALGDYFMHSIHYDWCVNCSAYTNTSAAQTTKDGYAMSYRLNALAPGYMAESCSFWNTKFIHVSTDYVFSEKSVGIYVNDLPTLLNVDDKLFPCNVYGEHKLIGEQFIKAAFGRRDSMYAILRTSWLYGRYNNKSFIHKFMKNAVKCVSEGRPVEVTSNEVSVPTSTAFLYGRILDVIECNEMATVVHAVPHSDKGVSRIEFAQAVLDSFKDEKLYRPDELTVHGKRITDIQLVPVDRDSYWPHFSAMSSKSTTDWKDDLNSYLSAGAGREVLEYAKGGAVS